jgi:uncharacterized membrane protein
MNKNAIRWLYGELPGLVGLGVLTADDEKRLRGHYGDAKPAPAGLIVFIGCAVLGALLVGLGIILLFGHNWEALPRSMRAALSLSTVVSGQIVAAWVLFKKPDSGFKEAAATFLSLMVGASIALIAQTYHMPGDTEGFLLTWMLLVAPVIYLMEASIPAALYLAGITAWVVLSRDANAPWFWLLAAVPVPHFL